MDFGSGNNEMINYSYYCVIDVERRVTTHARRTL